ncbi:MAG: class I SAM-dependent methyltransferase [Candidatus Altiarchaeota archaeon]
MTVKTRDLESFNEIAPYYDIFFKGVPGDRRFYVNEALKARSVLELTCGTGRITLAIAEKGVKVTGLDVSCEMLSKAMEKAARKGLDSTRFIKGDMRSFNLGEKFDLVIIPYNAFLHLITIADQKKALNNIGKHMTPKGRLIFDVFVPDLRKITGNHGKKFTTKSTKGIRLTETSYYDTLNQTIKVDSTFNKRKASMTLRYCFRDELLLLFETTGFKVESVYGGYRKQKLTEKSKQMVWILKKK